MPLLTVLRPGIMEYAEALALQEQLVGQRLAGTINDTLVLLSHPPVLTMGRRANEHNLLLTRAALAERGVAIHEVSRGGDVTYHGPGQLVGYPIVDLAICDRDIRRYITSVEEVIIRLLHYEFGITAYRDEKTYTGVYVGDDKITAIGVAIRKGVTYHGFAFNVNTDLAHFQWIVPCGLTDRGVTSLQKLTNQSYDLPVIEAMVARYFSEVFGYNSDFN